MIIELGKAPQHISAAVDIIGVGEGITHDFEGFSGVVFQNDFVFVAAQLAVEAVLLGLNVGDGLCVGVIVIVHLNADHLGINVLCIEESGQQRRVMQYSERRP